MNVFDDLSDRLEEEIADIEGGREVSMGDGDQPVGPHEIVIGTVADDVEIKALFSMCATMYAEVATLKEEHATICPPRPDERQRHDEIKSRLNVAEEEYKVVMGAMWLAIKRKFKKELGSGTDIIFREKWQIVRSDERASLQDLLTLLMPRN